MKVLRSTAVVLSSLLLAAHFLRDWNLFLVLLGLLPAVLLLLRGTWATRVAQMILALGALEWVRTTIVLVQDRQELGAPWGRMALILGTVILLALLSAALLETRHPRKRRLPEPAPGTWPAEAGPAGEPHAG